MNLIEGRCEELSQYIYGYVKIDSLSKDFDATAKMSVADSITDALIRYTEDIATALSSEETIAADSSANVEWVNKDGIHAIAIQAGIQQLVLTLMSNIPSFILNWLTKDWGSAISTIIQILVTVWTNNNRILNEVESRVYALCVDYACSRKNKFFTAEEIARYYNDEIKSNSVFQDVELTDDAIKDTCAILSQYHLLEPFGSSYRIVW